MLKLGMVGWRGMVGSVLSRKTTLSLSAPHSSLPVTPVAKHRKSLIQILFLKMPMIWTHWQPAT